MTGASNSCGDIPNLTDANQRLSRVCGREHFIMNRGECWNSRIPNHSDTSYSLYTCMLYVLLMYEWPFCVVNLIPESAAYNLYLSDY